MSTISGMDTGGELSMSGLSLSGFQGESFMEFPSDLNAVADSRLLLTPDQSLFGTPEPVQTFFMGSPAPMIGSPAHLIGSPAGIIGSPGPIIGSPVVTEVVTTTAMPGTTFTEATEQYRRRMAGLRAAVSRFQAAAAVQRERSRSGSPAVRNSLDRSRSRGKSLTRMMADRSLNASLNASLASGTSSLNVSGKVPSRPGTPGKPRGAPSDAGTSGPDDSKESSPSPAREGSEQGGFDDAGALAATMEEAETLRRMNSALSEMHETAAQQLARVEAEFETLQKEHAACATTQQKLKSAMQATYVTGLEREGNLREALRASEARNEQMRAWIGKLKHSTRKPTAKEIADISQQSTSTLDASTDLARAEEEHGKLKRAYAALVAEKAALDEERLTTEANFARSQCDLAAERALTITLREGQRSAQQHAIDVQVARDAAEREGELLRGKVEALEEEIAELVAQNQGANTSRGPGEYTSPAHWRAVNCSADESKERDLGPSELVAALRRRLAVMQDDHEEALDTLKERDREVSALAEQVERLERALQDLAGSVTERLATPAKNPAAARALEESERERARLEEELAVVRQRLATSEGNVLDEAKVAGLEASVATARDAVTELMRSARDDLARMKAAHAGNAALVVAVTTELGRAGSGGGGAGGAGVGRGRGKSPVKAKASAGMTDAFAATEAFVAARRQELDALWTRCERESARMAGLASSLGTELQRAETLSAAHYELEAQTHDAARALAHSVERCALLKAENDDLASRVGGSPGAGELTARLSALIEENELLRDESARARTECERLRRTVSNDSFERNGGAEASPKASPKPQNSPRGKRGKNGKKGKNDDATREDSLDASREKDFPPSTGLQVTSQPSDDSLAGRALGNSASSSVSELSAELERTRESLRVAERALEGKDKRHAAAIGAWGDEVTALEGQKQAVEDAFSERVSSLAMRLADAIGEGEAMAAAREEERVLWAKERAALTAAMRETAEGAERMETFLREQLSSLDLKLADALADCDSLTAERDRWERVREELLEDRYRNEESLRRTLDAGRKLEEQMRGLQAENARLMADAQEEIDQLRDLLGSTASRHGRALARLESSCASASSRLTALEDSSGSPVGSPVKEKSPSGDDEVHRRLSSLQREHADLLRIHSQCSAKPLADSASSSETASLRAELTALKEGSAQERERLERARLDSEDYAVRMATERDESDAARLKLCEMLSVCEHELDTAKDQEREALERAERLKRERDDSDERADRLESEREDSKRGNAALMEQVVTLTQQLRIAQGPGGSPRGSSGDARARADRLAEEVERLQEANGDLTAALEALKREGTTRVAEWDRERAENRTRLVDLTAQTKTLGAEVAALREKETKEPEPQAGGSENSETEALRARITELEAAVKEAERNVAAAESETLIISDEGERQCERLRREIATLKGDLTASRKRGDEVERDGLSLRASLDDSRAALARETSSMAREVAAAAVLTEEVRTLTARLSAAEQRAAEASRDADSARAAVTERDAAAKSLSDKATREKAALVEKAAAEKSAVEKELVVVTARLAAAEKIAETRQRTCDAMDVDLSQARNQFSQARDLLAQARDELTQARADVAAERARTATAEQAVHGNSEESFALAAELARLRVRLAEAEQEADELRALHPPHDMHARSGVRREASASPKGAVPREDVAALKAKLADGERATKEREQEVATMRAQLAELDAEARALRGNLADSEEEALSLRERMAQSTQEASVLRVRLAESVLEGGGASVPSPKRARDENALLRTQLDELQRQLQEAQTDREEALLELQEVHRVLEQLQAQLADSQREASEMRVRFEALIASVDAKPKSPKSPKNRKSSGSEEAVFLRARLENAQMNLDDSERRLAESEREVLELRARLAENETLSAEGPTRKKSPKSPKSPKGKSDDAFLRARFEDSQRDVATLRATVEELTTQNERDARARDAERADAQRALARTQASEDALDSLLAEMEVLREQLAKTQKELLVAAAARDTTQQQPSVDELRVLAGDLADARKRFQHSEREVIELRASLDLQERERAAEAERATRERDRTAAAAAVEQERLKREAGMLAGDLQAARRRFEQSEREFGVLRSALEEERAEREREITELSRAHGTRLTELRDARDALATELDAERSRALHAAAAGAEAAIGAAREIGSRAGEGDVAEQSPAHGASDAEREGVTRDGEAAALGGNVNTSGGGSSGAASRSASQTPPPGAPSPGRDHRDALAELRRKLADSESARCELETTVAQIRRSEASFERNKAFMSEMEAEREKAFGQLRDEMVVMAEYVRETTAETERLKEQELEMTDAVAALVAGAAAQSAELNTLRECLAQLFELCDESGSEDARDLSSLLTLLHARQAEGASFAADAAFSRARLGDVRGELDSTRELLREMKCELEAARAQISGARRELEEALRARDEAAAERDLLLAERVEAGAEFDALRGAVATLRQETSKRLEAAASAAATMPRFMAAVQTAEGSFACWGERQEALSAEGRSLFGHGLSLSADAIAALNASLERTNTSLQISPDRRNGSGQRRSPNPRLRSLEDAWADWAARDTALTGERAHLLHAGGDNVVEPAPAVDHDGDIVGQGGDAVEQATWDEAGAAGGSPSRQGYWTEDGYWVESGADGAGWYEEGWGETWPEEAQDAYPSDPASDPNGWASEGALVAAAQEIGVTTGAPAWWSAYERALASWEGSDAVLRAERDQILSRRFAGEDGIAAGEAQAEDGVNEATAQEDTAYEGLVADAEGHHPRGGMETTTALVDETTQTQEGQLTWDDWNQPLQDGSVRDNAAIATPTSGGSAVKTLAGLPGRVMASDAAPSSPWRARDDPLVLDLSVEADLELATLGEDWGWYEEMKEDKLRVATLETECERLRHHVSQLETYIESLQ